MKNETPAGPSGSRITAHKTALKTTYDRPGIYSESPSVSMPSQSALQSTPLAHQALRQFLLEMVALVYEVDPKMLMSPTRGRQKTAFARQVAMYLAHTGSGLSLSGVGRLFGRDRTTVAHGCALVEDARDDAVFDRTLSHMESAIACQMDLFRHFDQAHQAQKVQPAGMVTSPGVQI